MPSEVRELPTGGNQTKNIFICRYTVLNGDSVQQEMSPHVHLLRLHALINT